MKNRMYASRSMKAFVSALLAVSPFFAPACANDMNDGKSGETHFLCSTDDDCARHFGNETYYCGAAKYCTPKADGGHSGATGSGGATGTGGNGGSAASGGKGGSAGEFAGCKTPPDSTCSAADTCQAVGCPSLQYDEHACLRPQCNKDDDCASSERCAVSRCDAPTTCTVENGTCQCTSLTICGEVPRCNPTTTTGPRGEWVSLDMTVVQSPCIRPDACSITWHVAPDGHVTGTDTRNSTADGGVAIDRMLDQGQMFEIVAAVNGPDLRVALRDGIPCASQTATDVSLKVQLELSTQTLKSGELGACMGGDNVYALLYNELSH